MTTDNHILEIEQYGQSIWMDNLSRDLISSHQLEELIESRAIRGITSNPAIFEKAISGNVIYDADIEAGIRAGKPVEEIYESLTFDDIRKACDAFRSVYIASKGLDGYVSIEVPPTIARDTEATIREAKRYYEAIGRENVMIKIPGTPEGLPAVEATVAAGINVNVTLLFSVQSYVDTFWAYVRGLEKRAEAGEDISNIASVASFFLSRIDVKIDQQLDALVNVAEENAVKDELRRLRGKVAIANAKVAYENYKEMIESDRWKALEAKGAKVQRLLWASTGTKDPAYSDVMYVDELIGQDTVNTLPPNTIEACADHCDVGSDRIELNIEEAHQIIDNLAKHGIDIDQVMDELLIEGIDKFIKPFESLMNSLTLKIKQLTPA
ncbi:MAG: transaldolase [Merismopedia sp. SIO2A8]|nr:transaldolase [Symploca sp. SIO2B6]NET51863.1 transaldolase [Merismopedia sp. SIO2A8]